MGAPKAAAPASPGPVLSETTLSREQPQFPAGGTGALELCCHGARAARGASFSRSLAFRTQVQRRTAGPEGP